MEQSILELKEIQKGYQGNLVLKGINLVIHRGEFITFLGASGCGKTTTLRIIAGLEQPESGRVILDGEDVTEKEPNQRDVNTVFQSYALFPHMTVEENIGYGLKLKKLPKTTIKEKVQDVLNLVELQGFEKRKPNELSGGQKQRVAIGRAIINNPKILLLDEPLGALDLQLRRQMQLELKRLQKQLGITFLYITHDQEEAINMSDRIVVMNQGVFEQIGTPDEVYNHPKTTYVARFVGNSNIIKGKVIEVKQEEYEILIGQDKMVVNKEGTNFSIGQELTLAVRSENVLLCDEQWSRICATVVEKTFAGGQLRLECKLVDGTVLVVSRHGINSSYTVGDEIKVGWNPANGVIVDLEGGSHE